MKNAGLKWVLKSIIICTLLYGAFYLYLLHYRGIAKELRSGKHMEMAKRLRALTEREQTIPVSEFFPGDWDYVCTNYAFSVRGKYSVSGLQVEPNADYQVANREQPGNETLWQIAFYDMKRKFIYNYSIYDMVAGITTDNQDGAKNCFLKQTATFEVRSDGRLYLGDTK